MPLSYDAIASRRHSKGRPSNLPSSKETEALLSVEKRDLFTDDAWQGMLKCAQHPAELHTTCRADSDLPLMGKQG